MIHYIKHKDIDKSKWDGLIDKAINKNYYAYSWYLDLVCEGWDGLVEDDYISVMPVTKGRKMFLNYVYQPMSAQQLGVFSLKEITQPLVESFLKIISERFNFIEINLNYNNVFLFEGFSQRDMRNYELNLKASYLEIRRKFSENTRRNIIKAENANLTIEKNQDVNTAINLFKANKGQIYPNIKPENYRTLQNLVESLISMNKAEAWYVTDNQGTIMAGGFFLMFEDRIIFLFSGRREEAKDNKAMFFLFNRVIAENSDMNIILDCAGSNDPGVARFYRSFGAEEKKYQQIKRNTLPLFIRWLKK